MRLVGETLQSAGAKVAVSRDQLGDRPTDNEWTALLRLWLAVDDLARNAVRSIFNAHCFLMLSVGCGMLILFMTKGKRAMKNFK